MRKVYNSHVNGSVERNLSEWGFHHTHDLAEALWALGLPIPVKINGINKELVLGRGHQIGPKLPESVIMVVATGEDTSQEYYLIGRDKVFWPASTDVDTDVEKEVREILVAGLESTMNSNSKPYSSK